MAAHDTQATSTWTSGTTMTWSHTCAASAILGVWVGYNFSALSAITGVTYAGSAMTFVARCSNGSGANQIELWKHNSPSSGANNVVVTWDSAPSEGEGVSVSVTSASGWGTGVTAGPTSSTTPSVTIGSLGASDLPYAGVMDNGDPTQQDTAVAEAHTGGGAYVNVERQATGGDGVLNWTVGTPDEWLIVGARAIDSGGGGATAEKNFLTLLGSGA